MNLGEVADKIPHWLQRAYWSCRTPLGSQKVDGAVNPVRSIQSGGSRVPNFTTLTLTDGGSHKSAVGG
jgi:hypothetical protein